MVFEYMVHQCDFSEFLGSDNIETMATKLSLCAVSGPLNRMRECVRVAVTRTKMDSRSALNKIDSLSEDMNAWKEPKSETPIGRHIRKIGDPWSQ